MSGLSQEEKNFMLELHSATGGELDAQVSMYEIGTILGLDKGGATAMSQDLMVEELVELKTLSGGIGITEKGLARLQQEGLISGPAPSAVRLSAGPVIDGQDRREIDGLLVEITATTLSGPNGYQQFAELVFAVKTLEVQLLSPRPKTGIVRATLADIAGNLATLAATDLAKRITTFISS